MALHILHSAANLSAGCILAEVHTAHEHARIVPFLHVSSICHSDSGTMLCNTMLDDPVILNIISEWGSARISLAKSPNSIHHHHHHHHHHRHHHYHHHQSSSSVIIIVLCCVCLCVFVFVVCCAVILWYCGIVVLCCDIVVLRARLCVCVCVLSRKQ